MMDTNHSIPQHPNPEDGIHGNHGKNARFSQGSDVSLRVIIVGAGIGGLTAAIGLRRQGHEVIVKLLTVKDRCGSHTDLTNSC